MFLKHLKFLFAAASAAVSAKTSNPGLSASVDLSLLAEIKDTYMGQVLEQINNMTVPNVTIT